MDMAVETKAAMVVKRVYGFVVILYSWYIDWIDGYCEGDR